jgi:lipopolysaccharide transport system ATP-binding protein
MSVSGSLRTTSERPFDGREIAEVGGLERPAPPESAPEIVINARALTKVYTLYPSPVKQFLDLLGVYRVTPWRRPTFPVHQALAHVDLTIARGERVGIIGRNGAGKTTLLKIIIGAAEQTTGSLSVRGNVQALMQVGLGFHPEFTGRENIRGSLLYTGLNAEELRDAEEEIIAFCELGAYLDQPVRTYSLGMQSRLQFACATAIKPEILIVDEILGAGDAYFAVKSSMRMERLAKSGCTLLLVSHSMAQILQFCERCIWIDNGQIRRDGPVRDVVGDYEVHMSELAGQLGPADAGAATGGRAVRLHEAREIALRTTDIEKRHTQSLNDEVKVGDDSPDSHRPFFAMEATAGRVRLPDGQLAHRWAGEPGLKLETISIYSGETKVTRFQEGTDVEFRGAVRAELDGEVDFVVSITIFTLAGLRVFRLTSPRTRLHLAKDEIARFCVRLEPCRLLAGNYYVNLIIIPGSEFIGAPRRRYDLVARFCDFEVLSTLRYTEDGIVSHPASWRFNKGRE